MLQWKNLEDINPDLTPDVMSQVDEIIKQFKGKPGCLIPVLEECQRVGHDRRFEEPDFAFHQPA